MSSRGVNRKYISHSLCLTCLLEDKQSRGTDVYIGNMFCDHGCNVTRVGFTCSTFTCRERENVVAPLVTQRISVVDP